MNPNFFLVLILCTLPAFTSSKYLLVHVAENGGRESRSNPANNEKSLTLNIDQEPMNIESRDRANINYDIELGGKTKMVGDSIYHNPCNASVAFPMGDNIFIVACDDGWHLKMVKIRVTGETTFDWMEARYGWEEKIPTKCTAQETFTADCFVGESVAQKNYNVLLVAKQVSKWSDWSECSESCGSGFQVKTRKVFCKVKKNCKDEEKETRQCQIRNNQCEDV